MSVGWLNRYIYISIIMIMDDDNKFGLAIDCIIDIYF
jgi:hypothetical protein